MLVNRRGPMTLSEAGQAGALRGRKGLRMTDLIEGRDWLSSQSTYEGFPIYFRRPDIRFAEYSSLCADFPLRLTVTHFLAQVKDNGLPEADYNASLADFDHALIGLLRDSGAAIVTLVETFAGKRTYYLYLRQGVEPEAALRHVLDNFPRERVEWSTKQDPEWRLMNGYVQDFGFD